MLLEVIKRLIDGAIKTFHPKTPINYNVLPLSTFNGGYIKLSASHYNTFTSFFAKVAYLPNKTEPWHDNEYWLNLQTPVTFAECSSREQEHMA